MKEIQFEIIDVDSVKVLRPVTVSDILQPSSFTFHPDGLFSTEIFGAIGSETRNETFSYIDLKTNIIQPIIYTMLMKTRTLYSKIMQGKAYAVFSKSKKDFVESGSDTAGTGFAFFVKHLDELRLEDTGSTSRKEIIKLMKKYRGKLTCRKLLVTPAGTRDYLVTEEGRNKEDEINTLYRKLINSAAIIPGNFSVDSSMDDVAYNLQTSAMEVFDYISNLLLGKHTTINKKWVKRGVHNSTANVLTSAITEPKTIDSPSIGTNDVLVGIRQYSASILPLMSYYFKVSFIGEALPDKNSNMRLIDAKTKKMEFVESDPDYYDLWMSKSGNEKLLKIMASPELKLEDVVYTKGKRSYYMAMIVETSDGIAIINDTDSVSEDVIGLARPMKMAELLYITLNDSEDKVRGITTRYPAGNEGSVFPILPKIKITSQTREMKILDNSLKDTGEVYERYPMLDTNFFDSYSVSSSTISRLGADFDGDKLNYIGVFSSDAVEEIDQKLAGANYYKASTEGEMIHPASTDVNKLVLAHMMD